MRGGRAQRRTAGPECYKRVIHQALRLEAGPLEKAYLAVVAPASGRRTSKSSPSTVPRRPKRNTLVASAGLMRIFADGIRSAILHPGTFDETLAGFSLTAS